MSQYDFVITPQETRYVPAGAREIIDIGQRVCDSSTMIEAALRLGFEELLETPEFEQYQRDVAANTYSFDRVFARGLRLESQFEILMEILDEGIVGVNERGEVFASNHKLEEITGIPGARALQRPAAEVYPFVPFARCLAERAPQPAQVVSANGVNMNVAVAPVLRGGACIGAFATVQRFSDAENRQNELRSQLLHKGYRAKYAFDDVVGQSPAIRRCITILKKMSLTQLPVLLIGETGTGKELFAHAVHNASPRANGPFVAINCAAMPENLLESELFGYEEGAFTGARKGGKPGLFEFAHKGTLFLDEVEGMSTALQCKLLRVLQEREIMRLGDSQVTPINIRVIAATNKNLESLVRAGKFRSDLYYRLYVLQLNLPPLRERQEDIPLLTQSFLRNFQAREGDGCPLELSDGDCRLLQSCPWRGNIRELQNFCERLAVLYRPGVSVSGLIAHLLESAASPETPPPCPPPMPKAAHTRIDLSYEELLAVLQECGGNRTQTAAKLGISRGTLWRLLKKYQVGQT